MKTEFPDSMTFAPSFHELGVTAELIAENLGYPPSRMPPRMRSLTDEIIRQAPYHVSPQCGLVVLPPESFSMQEDRADCERTVLLMGDVIAPILKNARTLAIFIVTAGPGADKWISSLAAEGETLRAMIADAAATAAAEQAAGWLERATGDLASRRGWRISNRYSPGYCGWPTGDQEALFSLLPENFCGVRLTESAFMVPVKSVSGVIGLGPDLRRVGYRCAVCDMEDCFRRHEDQIAH